MEVDHMCAKVVFAEEGNGIRRATLIHAAPLKMLAMISVLVLHPSRSGCESDEWLAAIFKRTDIRSYVGKDMFSVASSAEPG
jgi:hypothetical protein